MNREQCKKCAYETRCFLLLKLWQALTNQCAQGRNKNRQTTLADITGDGTNAI